MIEKEKPAYCTISHNGGLFTVSYHARAPYTGMSLQGYGLEVFDGVPPETPVIRCDLAKLNAVLKAISGPEVGCLETHGPAFFGTRPTLAEMLDTYRACGVPVQTIGDLRLPQHDDAEDLNWEHTINEIFLGSFCPWHGRQSLRVQEGKREPREQPQ